MAYDKNKLPDFYSVRNYEQIDYSFEGMEGSKCFCFFDNGFSSNVIEPNKRDIKFIWDGFILFVDNDITLGDIQNGVDLYNARLVALQRTNILGTKFNGDEVRNYIVHKLETNGIPYEIMSDKRLVGGYPSKSDLWSTRDASVLLDAIDTVGLGDAYFFSNADFRFTIKFGDSSIPDFIYSHGGAVVLRGDSSTAISRLICNDQNLHDYVEGLVGDQVLYSFIEGKFLPGRSIGEIKSDISKNI